MRKETDLKHSIKLLQNEVTELNARLESCEDGGSGEDSLNRSQSSLIFKKIVDMSSSQSSPFGVSKSNNDASLADQLASYKEMRDKWNKRERDLVSLLKRTNEKLKTLKEEKCINCVIHGNSNNSNSSLVLDQATGHSSSLSKSRSELRTFDQDRLSDALAQSKQKVASLMRQKEQLENDLSSLRRDHQQLVYDKDGEVKNLRASFGRDRTKLENEFSDERRMMEEKHNLELEKLLLVEEVSCFVLFCSFID